MQEVIKDIGKGTLYEFDKYKVNRPLPGRNNNTYIDYNRWTDKQGYSYELKNNTLKITANDFFSYGSYSIIDYINDIPKDIDLKIILEVSTRQNEVAGINMLLNLLSVCSTKRSVLVALDYSFKFSNKMDLEFENLPDNVKITMMLDKNNNENQYFSNEYFENFALNIDDNKFNSLLTKVTSETAKRISRMREIAFDFYQHTPSSVLNGSNQDKAMYAYDWCCDNIYYDREAIKDDGNIRDDRHDAQDPLVTYDNRRGVCEGRARLLKLLINNYYMKVPCFCVKGMAGRLPHQWNEIVLEDGGILDLDISKQENRVARNHDELEIHGRIPKLPPRIR